MRTGSETGSFGGLVSRPRALEPGSNSGVTFRMVFVVTDRVTGTAAYFDAKRPEIFDLTRASSALPVIYPRAVVIDGQRYYDSGQSDAISRSVRVEALVSPSPGCADPPSRLPEKGPARGFYRTWSSGTHRRSPRRGRTCTNATTRRWISSRASRSHRLRWLQLRPRRLAWAACRGTAPGSAQRLTTEKTGPPST